MVTRDTRWPAGTPCWVDVSVDDVPKAIAFYQALFGWDIQAGGPEVGGYAIAHLNGRIVAGISPKFAAPDAPSAWTTYLAADDANAVAEKIKAAGGQVMQGPVDVMEEGRMAIALDPTGAAFGLWQGGQTTGIGLANQTGALTWNEHVSWDFNAGQAFYRAVFGYEYQDVSGEGFRYAMLMVDGREVGGIGQYLPETPAGTRPPGAPTSPSTTPTPRWPPPSSTAAASCTPSGTARTAGSASSPTTKARSSRCSPARSRSKRR